MDQSKEYRVSRPISDVIFEIFVVVFLVLFVIITLYFSIHLLICFKNDSITVEDTNKEKQYTLVMNGKVTARSILHT